MKNRFAPYCANLFFIHVPTSSLNSSPEQMVSSDAYCQLSNKRRTRSEDEFSQLPARSGRCRYRRTFCEDGRAHPHPHAPSCVSGCPSSPGGAGCARRPGENRDLLEGIFRDECHLLRPCGISSDGEQLMCP